MTAFWFWFLTLGLPPLLLALPAIRKGFSWGRYFRAFLTALFGVVLPLWGYYLSALLVPDWKGGCDYGWVDCFHVGKLLLTPLVLWAFVAFYVKQIVKPVEKPRIWVDLGILVGAVTGTVCCVFGYFVIILAGFELPYLMLIPLFITGWAWLLVLTRPLPSLKAMYLTFIGSLPFWIASVYLSKKKYLDLPEVSPDCFVVTAAQRGHANLVGPFTQIQRRGAPFEANAQLQTFWAFERVWARKSPRSHKVFRWMYNRVGPVIARRIRSRWAADLMYLILKPFELMVRFFL